MRFPRSRSTSEERADLTPPAPASLPQAPVTHCCKHGAVPCASEPTLSVTRSMMDADSGFAFKEFLLLH